MTTDAPAPRAASVLVGDDGSRHSSRAVDHAVDEAARRELPLAVLRVVRAGVDPDHSVAAQRRDLDREVDEARYRLGATLDRARSRRPGTEVSGDVLVAPGAGELERYLQGRVLVVVGARSDRGLRAFTLDSTSRDLLHAARCPLVVVPDEGSEPPLDGPGPRTVVVGLAPGPLGDAALRTAVEQAARRGADLRVVHAYDAGHDVAGDDAQAARARATAFCEERVAAVVDDAAVPVSVEVTPDPPGLALLRAARGADLLVVGSRGPLALARLTLDSVSRTVLDGVPCPVLLVLTTEGAPGSSAPEPETARV